MPPPLSAWPPQIELTRGFALARGRALPPAVAMTIESRNALEPPGRQVGDARCSSAVLLFTPVGFKVVVAPRNPPRYPDAVLTRWLTCGRERLASGRTIHNIPTSHTTLIQIDGAIDKYGYHAKLAGNQ